jgi:hypothetical protein
MDNDAALMHTLGLLDKMTRRGESMVKLPSCNRG